MSNKINNPIVPVEKSITDSIRNMEEINHLIAESTSAMIQEVADINSELMKDLTESMKESISSMIKTASDALYYTKYEKDYAIVDEGPVKEWSVPDSVTIRVGHNRIRISTSLLVAIIGVVISVIISLYSSSLQEQRNQTKILQDLLESIDATNSSQKELFEDIRSALESSGSDQLQDQPTGENNPE